MMPHSMSEAERSAYRDGQVDAQLEQHEKHLRAINGSIDRTATTLIKLERSVDTLSDKLTGILLVMPQIQTIAEKQTLEVEVARALHQRAVDGQTTWSRYRAIVAWGVGVLVALVTSANFALNHLT